MTEHANNISLAESKEEELCDLEATYMEILAKFHNLPTKNFSNFVKDLPCYKYKVVPNSFFLEIKRNDLKNRNPYFLKNLKRHWIRHKRSLMSVNEDGYTEDNGIYNPLSKLRRKRALDLKLLTEGLRCLPNLSDTQNDVYAILGDTVTIGCEDDDENKLAKSQKPCQWTAEQNAMLNYEHVIADDQKIVFRDVQPRNIGVYNCTKNNNLHRSVKLHVVTIPSFNIVSTPAYDAATGCHYDDLKAFQDGLATEMSRLACSDDSFCTVRVDEPVCVRDEETDKASLRLTAVLTPTRVPLACGAQCSRDLASSLALLAAGNVPALLSVPVTVFNGERNRTFTASTGATGGDQKWIITHTLRSRDSNHHHEFTSLTSSMMPGDLNVVVLCPAGYYLLPEKKICEACPNNTFARSGATSCTPCPRGASTAQPASAECQYQLRRYTSRFAFISKYTLVAALLLCLCAVGALCTRPAVGTSENTGAEEPAASQARPVRRPLSPSRVILARLFRGSSSRAATVAESQSIRLQDCAEESNPPPPPLPPIDFDY